MLLYVNIPVCHILMNWLNAIVLKYSFVSYFQGSGDIHNDIQEISTLQDPDVVSGHASKLYQVDVSRQ